MSNISIDNQINDLDTIIFALRSVPASESVVSGLIADLEDVKSCLRDSKSLSLVYQNYFERNNISKDTQNHLTMNMTDKCVSPIKGKASTILELIKPLNYPLPAILLTKLAIQEGETEFDPILDFELKMYNWLKSIKHNPMDVKLLNDLRTQEGMRDLNLRIPDNFLGFVTYGTIIDTWNYKDLRLNKSIDALLKEWNAKGILDTLHIQCRNEFLTLKNGLIIVSKK